VVGRSTKRLRNKFSNFFQNYQEKLGNVGGRCSKCFASEGWVGKWSAGVLSAYGTNFPTFSKIIRKRCETLVEGVVSVLQVRVGWESGRQKY